MRADDVDTKHIAEYLRRSLCLTRFVVRGRGVVDKFQDRCSINLAVGEPRNLFDLDDVDRRRGYGQRIKSLLAPPSQ